MRRRFVIGLGDLPEDQQKAMHTRLRELGCGWWHWISGIWFVVTSEKATAKKLMDVVRQYSADSNVVVMEIESKDWITYGPEAQGKSFSSWFHRYFSQESNNEEKES